MLRLSELLVDTPLDTADLIELQFDQLFERLLPLEDVEEVKDGAEPTEEPIRIEEDGRLDPTDKI